MKVRLTALILAMICFTTAIPIVQGVTERFSDVPKGHWADEYIHKLRELDITNGRKDNRFGMGESISKSEFVTFLVRLMKWDIIVPDEGSFFDNQESSKWYFSYIETAVKHGVIPTDEDYFLPLEPITREEMAVMIVKTLGYDGLAKRFELTVSPFDDVSENIGYIKIAKDMGIIGGVGNNLFKPNDTAKREAAAAMMIRMYDKLNQPLEEIHGFYSYSSYTQKSIISDMDSVSFDNGLLKYNESSNVFYLDVKESSQVNELLESNSSQEKYLMITSIWDEQVTTAAGESDLLVYFLGNEIFWEELNQDIIHVLDSTSNYDGIVIDFEQLKGDAVKEEFNQYLSQLNTELDSINKSLIVAVHPSNSSYNGYDYKTIGAIADKVILMAHDYNAKTLNAADMKQGYTMTPLTPIYRIYDALKTITDEDTGIQDKDKILLQISFDSAQWEVKNGEVIRSSAWRPTYDKIYNRLIKDGTDIVFYQSFMNPCATYTNEQTGVFNVIWYENAQSVSEKVKLAKMFGINRVSLWKIGNIPDYDDVGDKEVDLDVWGELKSLR